MGKGRARGFAAFRDALSEDEILKLPQGTYCDGAGLYLVVGQNVKRWSYKYSEYGKTRKQRNINLGHHPKVSLNEARRQRAALEKVVLQGGDPKTEALPAKRRRSVGRYPWKTLKKGEFFDIHTFKNVGSAKHLLKYGEQISGFKFSAMSTADGVRVWRIE